MKNTSSDAISVSIIKLFSATKSKSKWQFVSVSEIKSNLMSRLPDWLVSNPTLVSDLDSITKSENLLNPAGCARESIVSSHLDTGISDLTEYERFW